MDGRMVSPIALIAAGCLLSSMLVGCSTNKLTQSNDNVSVVADKSKQSSANDDLQNLKAQLEQQQAQLETMNAEQQALQEQLKRQQITLTIKPTANANAGHASQGTASIAYVAFLESENQFTDVEALAAKEVNIIPNRETSLTLTIPQEARFVAVKVGLRYTKKRSQMLIPLDSFDFDTSLTLNVGACDVNITEGIDPARSPTFTTKLNYYQQPLVSCS